MFKKIIILLTAMLVFFGCQVKQKEAQEIPMNTFVKIYVSALRVDSLMNQYQKPESFPDAVLNTICKSHNFSSQDFKHTHNVFNSNSAKKIELDSLLKQAIEAETMKSLNGKETENN